MSQAHRRLSRACSHSSIHCQNCVRTIENAFNSQEGFYAKVNTEDNTVTILSKQQHPTDELINTLSNVGYTSKEL